MIIEEKITFDKFIRWSLTALVVIVVLLLMNYLSSVLLPFFVAWLLAYLVYPVVKFVQYRLHVPTRLLSIIVSLVFLVAVIGGVFYLRMRSNVTVTEECQFSIVYHVLPGLFRGEDRA